MLLKDSGLTVSKVVHVLLWFYSYLHCSVLNYLFVVHLAPLLIPKVTLLLRHGVFAVSSPAPEAALT